MIIYIFGYCINIFKLTKPKVASRICQIRRVDKYLHLCDHEGVNRFPIQTKMTLHNNVNEQSLATIELYVDVTNIDLPPIPVDSLYAKS